MSTSPIEIQSSASKLLLRDSLLLKFVAGLGSSDDEAEPEQVAIGSPTFRGAAKSIQTYRGSEWILSGPSETGKTWATLWLLDHLLSTTPYAKAVIVRKVAADIGSTVLQTYKATIERSGSGAKPYGGEKPLWYDYPNGARVYLIGMDRPGKILSGEFDWIYFNQAEEGTLQDWETLTTRTTGRGAVTSTPMCFGDCNPGPEDHWILKRESLKLLESKHEDNPSLFNERGRVTAQGERTMRTLDALTGIRKARLRYGKWVGADGLFFETFDFDLIVKDPFPLAADWYKWGALDYGFVHPTAAGLFAEDNDGNVILFAEHGAHKWLPPMHCKAIRRQCELAKVPWHQIKQVVAGHDVFAQRGDKDGKTIADQYKEAKDPETGESIGINLQRATIERVTGAQEIMTRLGNPEVKIRPTLIIFSTCKKTISALTRMVTDPRDPEDVLKVNADVNGEGGDDFYDMLRYGVMVRRRVVKPRVQSRSYSTFT